MAITQIVEAKDLAIMNMFLCQGKPTSPHHCKDGVNNVIVDCGLVGCDAM
jgi:hypothetical protein